MSRRLFGSLPSYWRSADYFVRGWIWAQIIRMAGGTVGSGLRVEPGVQFRQAIHSGYVFGDDVLVGAGTVFDIGPAARLTVGHRVTLTRGEFISALIGVEIGDDALIGEYCSIRDSDHGFDDLATPINVQPMVSAAVFIGQDAWIGRGTAVLRGSRIGEGAVIGAQSLVKGSIAPYAIAFGAPAKVKGTRRP